MGSQIRLPGFAPSASEVLAENHYLGPLARGQVYRDRFGVVIVSAPTSRALPGSWLEVARWCIVSDDANAGTRQWSGLRRWIGERFPSATTVVSYSDPSAGHDGALYRACNWLWAPTWHRLRPPPTRGGRWAPGRKIEAVKDRWVFPLMPDPERAAVLALKDTALKNRFPWAEYAEPRWKRGRFNPATGGGDWKRWRRCAEGSERGGAVPSEEV